MSAYFTSLQLAHWKSNTDTIQPQGNVHKMAKNNSLYTDIAELIILNSCCGIQNNQWGKHIFHFHFVP